MKKRQFLITYKLFFAGLVVVTIAAQLHYSVQKVNFSFVNFFSYFTIESNFFAAAVFLMTAYLLIGNRKRSHGQEMLRGAATLYMVTTGIVYAVLLSHANVQITLPWVNDVLHRIFPLVLLADWLYDRPARKITDKQALRWLIYPVVYAAYTLIRGPLANHWYPYPFIDPAQHGYPAIAVNCVVIGVFIALLAQIIARLPRWTRARNR